MIGISADSTPPATRATLPVAYNVPNDARLRTNPPTSAGIEGAALPWLDVTPPAPSACALP